MFDMNLPPELQEAFDRLVTAGLKVIAENGLEDDLDDAEDKPAALAEAIVGLMGLLMQEANGTPPPQVILPAIVQLVGHGAEYMEKAGIGQLSEDELASTVGQAVGMVLDDAGIDPRAVSDGQPEQPKQAAQDREQGRAPPPWAGGGIVAGAMK